MPDSLENKSEAELASRKGTEKFVEYEFVDYKGASPNSIVRSMTWHIVLTVTPSSGG
jgi:hypothetical protein